MEVHTTKNVNCNPRGDWRPGIWDDEPDYVNWTDDTTGYICIARRHELFGFWCGYVVIPESHPLYEKDDYSEFPDEVQDAAHCGITWANYHNDFGEWVIGFDCGHTWDDRPFNQSACDSIYRDIEYVKRRVAKLALALSATRQRVSILECREIIAAIGEQGELESASKDPLPADQQEKQGKLENK